MRRFRSRLSSLVILIVLSAVGLAALRESDKTWETALFTLTAGFLLISILLAVHRTDSDRAFWIGFAMFGWVYLALSLVPSIESRLMTKKALTYLDDNMAVRSASKWSINTIQMNYAAALRGQNLTFGRSNMRMGVFLWGGTTENFVRIGHSLSALLVGWFGGLLSRRFWRSSRSTEPTTEVEAQGTAP